MRIIDQMQDLETISAKIAGEEKIRQVEEQVKKKFAVNRGHQAETELEWTAKWNEIIRTIENNKNNISNLESQTRNETTGENNTEHEEEDDQELVDNKVDGYFQRFFQKLRIQQQSLQNFCKNWQLDCRVIALGGMIMTIIGAGCTIVVIILAIKTYTIARKVEGIWEYLDIKETRKEQEEDDQMWREMIGRGCTVLRPNPTRNQEQIKKTRRN